MSKVRLTKEFRFEMAHALWNYDGLCRNIHGHSYILQVTIIGEPVSDMDNPKLGMVMDFGVLKDLVRKEIVKPLDHAIVVYNKIPQSHIESLGQMSNKVVPVNYQPTCENLLIDFAERLMNKLPEDVKLFSLKLHETGSSFAEWFASDNV